MQFEVGSIVEGKVNRITKFGAFVELAPGKTGMVHISEVANSYVNDINDFLQEGQTVKVKVLSISEDGKIALSIKKTLPPPRSGNPAGRAAIGKAVHGKAVPALPDPVLPRTAVPKPSTIAADLIRRPPVTRASTICSAALWPAATKSSAASRKTTRCPAGAAAAGDGNRKILLDRIFMLWYNTKTKTKQNPSSFSPVS